MTGTADSDVQTMQQVVRPSTGEHGTVLNVNDRGFARVQLADRLVTLHVSELQAVDDDEALLDQLGEPGRAYPFSLRLRARYLKHAFRYDPASGLSNSRIEPQHYQIAVAHRVIRKIQPRMILADEVGLGKTIEAGLILKELRARELVERVLVVVPASLQEQWRSELSSKFNEDFEILDGPAVKHYGRGRANPFEAVPNVITSLAFGARAERMEQIHHAAWDLAIFDEAHRVRRSRNGTTKAYELADGLRDHVDGLLLLTATPMQLDVSELYALVELVEPGLYLGQEQFVDGQRGIRPLNELCRSLQDWSALSPGEQEKVLDLHRDLLASHGPVEELPERLVNPDERVHILDQLTEKHPLAQVLVRNRKSQVGIRSDRRAQRIPVTLTHEQLDLYDAVSAYLRDGYNRAMQVQQRAVGFLMVIYHKMLASSSQAIRVSLEKRVAKLRDQRKALQKRKAIRLGEERQQELRELEDVSTKLDDLELAILDPEGLDEEIHELETLIRRLRGLQDPKAVRLVEVLLELLENDTDEKVIIFTQYRETQAFLVKTLEFNGLSCVTFHGGMSREEKELAVTEFRRNVQILISTESGGEGRNFQFCRTLVNFDLPWNPMRVEQRIGRVDRIGQTRPVIIRNLYCEDTIEARVVDVLETRIRVFTEAVGALDPILGDVEASLERVAMSENYDVAFAELGDDLDRRIARAREAERTFDADFALDRASFRQDEANELLNRDPAADWHDLQGYVTDALNYYGGTLTEDAEGIATISLAPPLKSQLAEPHSLHQGAFDPRVAREHEELPFFAMGHPLIDALVSLPLERNEPRSATVPVESDRPLVEVWYRVKAHGIRATAEVRRHTIAADLEVSSEIAQRPPPHHERDAEEPLPQWAEEALAKSQKRAEEELTALRDQAQADHLHLQAEQRERAIRIFDQREQRLRARLAANAALIEEKEGSDDEDERRIVPALHGRVRADRERLEQVEADRDVELSRIAAQEVSADLECLGVQLGAAE